MPRILLISWRNNRPTAAAFFNGKKIKEYKLWDKNYSQTIIDVQNKEEEIKNIVNNSDEIIIPNYKTYLDYFDIGDPGDVYDYPIKFDTIKEAIILLLKNKGDLLAEWQRIRAEAAVVYHKLEKKGILLDYKLVHPHYDMDVYSGRSKTTGFNIQGANEEWDIRHIHNGYTLFVNFDWIAADHRIGAYLSGDKKLNECYKNSDPYSYMEDVLDHRIDRGVCKLELMRAVNALDSRNEVLSIFPDFAKWILTQKKKLDTRGYVKSIMGRKFYTDGTKKGHRRAFNGILQGSVAHAMNSCVSKVDEIGDIIVAEQHDSLTIATNEKMLKYHINEVSKIMVSPLDNYDLRMPLKIQIGRRWRQYKYFKEVR